MTTWITAYVLFGIPWTIAIGLPVIDGGMFENKTNKMLARMLILTPVWPLCLLYLSWKGVRALLSLSTDVGRTVLETADLSELTPKSLIRRREQEAEAGELSIASKEEGGELSISKEAGLCSLCGVRESSKVWGVHGEIYEARASIKEGE